MIAQPTRNDPLAQLVRSLDKCGKTRLCSGWGELEEFEGGNAGQMKGITLEDGLSERAVIS